MTTDDITAVVLFRLVREGTDPTEPVCTVTPRDVVSAVVRRLETRALDLEPADLLAACKEVSAACEHHDCARNLIEIGLDAWEITRTL